MKMTKREKQLAKIAAKRKAEVERAEKFLAQAQAASEGRLTTSTKGL